MNRKAHVACNFNCLFENERPLKVTAQPVKYTVNVVIYRNRFQVKSLLLQSTNRKWYKAYRTEIIPMT